MNPSYLLAPQSPTQPFLSHQTEGALRDQVASGKLLATSNRKNPGKLFWMLESYHLFDFFSVLLFTPVVEKRWHIVSTIQLEGSPGKKYSVLAWFQDLCDSG